MKATILGGAGFLGSLISKECVNRGYKTTVIDGLFPHTGGRKENIIEIQDEVCFIPIRIEEIKDIEGILKSSDFLVSAMGWTSHRSAMENPDYDIELNLLSHVHLIRKMCKDSNLIFLGSRGQFGSVSTPISENGLMVPEDVQGIDKVAAESYCRVFSKKMGFNVTSLRLPNCYGEHQPVSGSDIGLIGGMIRNLINNEQIKIFGHQRMRGLLYGDDCAHIVCDLAEKGFSGFTPYNIKGQYISIEELGRKLINLIGKGSISFEEIPPEIKSIDMGNAPMNEGRLQSLIGTIRYTNIDVALLKTIKYFKKELRI